MKKREAETASFLSHLETRSEVGRGLEHLKRYSASLITSCLLPGLQHIAGGDTQRGHC